MAEFQEGMLDTLMERLCNSIAGFDPEWVKRCVPATEEQIQQLQDILAEYHYTIPAAYLWYLRKMGKDDDDLLERELDFCEADIDTVLELQNEEDLEKGLLCFAYSDPFTIGFYMKLSSMDDNPSVVADWEEKMRKALKSICSRGRFICITKALHIVLFTVVLLYAMRRKTRTSAGHVRINGLQQKNVWIGLLGQRSHMA